MDDCAPLTTQLLPARVATTARALPLAVDLDGTLSPADTFIEALTRAAIDNPWRVVSVLARLGCGRQHLKQAILEAAGFDPALLPYRVDLLDWLKSEHARGRELHLVTAAPQAVADAVARHLGIFASATGSSSEVNLKGPAKAAFLREAFPDGFAYAGDSAADLAVWEAADEAVLAGQGVQRRARVAQRTPVVAEFPDRGAPLGLFMRMLRLRQWSKNAVIFVPLILGHQLGNLHLILNVLLAFITFGAVVSATYIMNDLIDLAEDRRHPTKRARPIASGEVPAQVAVLTALILAAAGLIGAAQISAGFLGGVLAYVAITIGYSLRFKRIALLDVTVIGLLFSLRVVMGMVAIGQSLAPWLLAFSILFFCSLALAKRHGEIMKARLGSVTSIAKRGYRVEDWVLTLSFGVAASLGAIIIMLLYIRLEATQNGLYHHPDWLFIPPVCVLVWVQRIWLLSNRAEMNDDPVAFALSDRGSWYLLAVIAGSVVLAQ